MKRFLRTLTVALVCGILLSPSAEAQGRREGNNRHRTENTNRGHRRQNNGKKSPHRHYATHPYHRPVPPPSFRPHPGCPTFHNILGITFGTALNISLSHLHHSGFIVSSYSNDAVYLRNVTQMSMIWPDAVLFYGPSGLCGSRFCHSTGYYDRTRYNQIYTTFVGRYGAPVRYEAINNGFAATWFGKDGYISLEYSPGYASDGSLRYYTTLSIGN